MTEKEYDAIRASLVKFVHGADDPFKAVEIIREIVHELSPVNGQPVDLVRWVPIGDVEPNDYNPNSVAHMEMGLLLTSILKDGYTQPIVTIWDPERGKYVIVDGFHRYYTCLMNEEVRERCKGLLPIVVIEKDIAERMAATVRHNRARGKHSVTGMAKMVFDLLNNGMDEAQVCNELGMEPEEVARLQHITGFSKLFENADYSRSWQTRHQVIVRMKRQASDKAAEEHAKK